MIEPVALFCVVGAAGIDRGQTPEGGMACVGLRGVGGEAAFAGTHNLYGQTELSVRSFSIPRTRSTTIARPGSPLAACLRSRKVLAARMGRSAKVSRMGMPAFDKNKKMSANAASGKPQSAQASGSAIKKAAPKKKVEKKKASFKGDTFAGKPSKKA